MADLGDKRSWRLMHAFGIGWFWQEILPDNDEVIEEHQHAQIPWKLVRQRRQLREVYPSDCLRLLGLNAFAKGFDPESASAALEPLLRAEAASRQPVSVNFKRIQPLRGLRYPSIRSVLTTASLKDPGQPVDTLGRVERIVQIAKEYGYWDADFEMTMLADPSDDDRRDSLANVMTDMLADLRHFASYFDLDLSRSECLAGGHFSTEKPDVCNGDYVFITRDGYRLTYDSDLKVWSDGDLSFDFLEYDWAGWPIESSGERLAGRFERVNQDAS